MRIIKSILLSLLLLFCSSQVGMCYEITEAELTTLETRLATLKQQRAMLQSQFLELKQQQETLDEQVRILELQLATSKERSSSLEMQLRTVNESFEQYAKEVKSKQRCLKWQRSMWQVIAVGCTAWAIERSIND